MRATKFRQAAFTYLHVAILYEAAGYVMWRNGNLPTQFGPPWIWLVFGGLVAGLVVFGLLRWQEPWFARVVWFIHGLRLPALVKGAFFAQATATTPSSFYIVGIVAVTINLWMLARAGWDL